MSEHLKPWLAHLSCTHATPTSVAATPGNWVSCGVCHDQRLIRSVSRVAPLKFVQGELLTPEELSELEAA